MVRGAILGSNLQAPARALYKYNRLNACTGTGISLGIPMKSTVDVKVSVQVDVAKCLAVILAAIKLYLMFP